MNSRPRKFCIGILDPQEIEGIIYEIIESIPPEWETYEDRAYLAQILTARAVNKKIFE